LVEAKSYIEEARCEYDKYLLESIDKGIDGLSICNPRLNVDIITGNE
jgi:hypothetical protein